MTVSQPRRLKILPRLGIAPSVSELVRAELTTAIDVAARRSEAVAVLDAGCGRMSALRPFRDRIERFVGADLHPVEHGSLPFLDEFVVADLCRDANSFPESTFDIVLSSFTIEHFAEPRAAFANFARWLRPGGVLVATTVNRRHPFVGAYLSAPSPLRDAAQRYMKANAEAHRIVGACNSPQEIRDALDAAGFESVRMSVVGNLAHAWRRRVPTFAVGLVGDILASSIPSRRSTIVVAATKRASTG